MTSGEHSNRGNMGKNHTTNKADEIIRCSSCGKVRVNHLDQTGVSMQNRLKNIVFVCQTCGWSHELERSPHYSWLYVF
jgi:transcription elongation factor Elf1